MNTTGYKIGETINDKWYVLPGQGPNFVADWETGKPLKSGKLGFTITQVSVTEFELSYVLRRDGIFESYPTLGAAMQRADEIAKGF